MKGLVYTDLHYLILHKQFFLQVAVAAILWCFPYTLSTQPAALDVMHATGAFYAVLVYVSHACTDTPVLSCTTNTTLCCYCYCRCCYYYHF
jgi:hypothetical protein